MEKNFIPLNSLTKRVKEIVDKCIYSIQERERFYGLESRTDGFISLRTAICLESEVTWANGRVGLIIDKHNDGFYSFFSPKELEVVEAEIGEDENARCFLHEIADGGEYVAIGILGFWLKYGEGESIKEVFKAYTEMRLNAYIEINKTHPQSWKWSWKYKFYVEEAIEEEKRLNRMSEAIFDFVDGANVDIEEARSVMTEYISYLESERDEQLAKHASKAPRAIATREDCSFEDMASKPAKGGNSKYRLPAVLDTKKVREAIEIAIKKGWMKNENGKLLWIGLGKGKVTQLAYFFAKIFGYVISASGNKGNKTPWKEIQRYFGIETRMNDLLYKVGGRDTTQPWQLTIDEAFENMEEEKS